MKKGINREGKGTVGYLAPQILVPWAARLCYCCWHCKAVWWGPCAPTGSTVYKFNLQELRLNIDDDEAAVWFTDCLYLSLVT